LLAPTEGINLDGRQVDAMMFAQERGWPTINGYSGNLPPGYIQPVTCRDGFEDLAAGLAFFGNPASLPTEARRVVAVGFGACPEGALRR
jgi:hypothetical protein